MTSTIDHTVAAPADHELVHRPPAVSLRALTKRYGDRVAVDALTIEVPAGVVAGFVGPNGAGKTTTMAMLLGLVAPTEGNGNVLGEPLDDPASFLGSVGALIEGPAFYPGLTGAQNLAVPATAAGHNADQVRGLLELVGLADRGDDRFRGYSFGMKQRLGIAGALTRRPAAADPRRAHQRPGPRRRARDARPDRPTGQRGADRARVLACPCRAGAGQ